MISSLLIAIVSAVSFAASAPTLLARQATTVRESLPFNLIVECSANATLNGRQLYAAHSGAAIEQLVLGSQSVSNFSAGLFNMNISSSTAQMYPNITGELGNIVWTLPGSSFNMSEPLVYLYDPAYNTAVMQFAPAVGAIFGFLNDYLVVPETLDSGSPPLRALERWYICTFGYAQGGGYSYTALAWGLGSYTPDNESCQSVRVKRVFV